MLLAVTALLELPVTAICVTVKVFPSASVSSATNKPEPVLCVTVASSLTLSVSFAATGGLPAVTENVKVVEEVNEPSETT